MTLVKKLWSRWKKIAHKIGVFQSRVILTIFYFVILLPFGIIFTYFKDELTIKIKKKSAWRNKVNQTTTLDELKNQY